MEVDTIDARGGNLPEDLFDLNPYQSVRTLVDRDLVIYDSRAIIEYALPIFSRGFRESRSPAEQSMRG